MLKIIEFLFDFFISILKIFVPFAKQLLIIFKYDPDVLNSAAILSAVGVGSFVIGTGVKFLASLIPGASYVADIFSEGLEYGKNVIKQAYKLFLSLIIFIFRLMPTIFNFLSKFILQILNFIYLLFKVWFYFLKKAIIIISFIFGLVSNLIILCFLEEPEIKKNDVNNVKNALNKIIVETKQIIKDNEDLKKY